MKPREYLKSPHIQIALATGVCIVVLAFVSKRILPAPIGYVPLAVPPFLMTVHELVLKRYKNARICTTWYWIVAIFVTTALVILFHVV